jgi:hypothetical protein
VIDEAFTAELDGLAVYTDRGTMSKTVYESSGVNNDAPPR